MNIFVTGANGYIGRNFIKKVTKYKHKIFAVTRKKNLLISVQKAQKTFF